jgi:4-hydroxy-tetrahydrodipicolinate synthase
MKFSNFFSGTFTALVTPFLNNKIDYVSLEKIIQFQKENGVNGFVICGTTGESTSLVKKEKIELFNFVKNLKMKNTPLIFGCGGNNTEQVIDEIKTKEFEDCDAFLSVVPYYNKPPQRGLEQHFIKIANSASKPVILYNVPSRTITKLELSTIKSLSENKNIIGIKEASGDTNFALQISKTCHDDFVLLSGDDASYEDFLKSGGHGIISVASHILPKQFTQKKINNFKSLIEILFIESNPIPIKYALYIMGQIQSPELRLPLVSLKEELQSKLRAELEISGLI